MTSFTLSPISCPFEARFPPVRYKMALGLIYLCSLEAKTEQYVKNNTTNEVILNVAAEQPCMWGSMAGLCIYKWLTSTKDASSFTLVDLILSLVVPLTDDSIKRAQIAAEACQLLVNLLYNVIKPITGKPGEMELSIHVYWRREMTRKARIDFKWPARDTVMAVKIITCR